jgi:signal transduction histidine kinase
LNRQRIVILGAGDLKSGKDERHAVLQRLSLEPGADGVIRPQINRNNEGAWRLVVKHRAGSLEAAVAATRRRNLAINFGILLLLGASVGFIVLSSRRAQRLATQQMEFVAGVSHELRTPLAVICSAAENLADGVIDGRDQIKRYGGLIRDEGRRLTGMVEQVLEFAGAQSGRKNYELRATELTQVIEDAITACHLQLAEGDFEIERKIAPHLPPIKADAAALSRAVQNLISNAMKYGGSSRWIGLSAETVKTSAGEEVQIRVSDHGLGIAPSEQERIFEPFYRGKVVAAAQIRGNGLGLSLVKHIIAAHGGRVSVESKVGQGSTFILHLPILATVERSVETVAESDLQTRFNISQPTDK